MIFAAVPSGAVRAHIADSLRPIADVLFRDRVADLVTVDRTVIPKVGLFYLDGSYDRLDSDRWIAAIRQLRALWTSLPLIGYAPVTAKAFRQGLHAASVGMDEIALHGWDTLPDVVGRVLRANGTRDMTAEIMRRVRGGIGTMPDNASAIVGYCVEHARPGLTVEQLAVEVGLSRRTLAYRLRDARLPAPESLIMWTRLLVAAWLLRDPDCSVNAAARALGWREVSGLRSLTMSYLGCQPTVLRQPGAISQIVMTMAHLTAANGAFPSADALIVSPDFHMVATMARQA